MGGAATLPKRIARSASAPLLSTPFHKFDDVLWLRIVMS